MMLYLSFPIILIALAVYNYVSGAGSCDPTPEERIKFINDTHTCKMTVCNTVKRARARAYHYYGMN